MTGATWRRACQREARTRCEPGPNFRDFRDFTLHKGERLSFVGGPGDSEVWEVSEDCAALGTAMGRLKTTQPDASRVIRDARACGTPPLRAVAIIAAAAAETEARQKETRQEPMKQLARHRLPGPDGGPEIAEQHGRQPQEVLRRQLPIQAEARAQRGERVRVGRLVRFQQGQQDGVARGRPRQGEGDQASREQQDEKSRRAPHRISA